MGLSWLGTWSPDSWGGWGCGKCRAGCDMVDGRKARHSSANEAAELRRRVAELERANERLRRQLPGTRRHSDQSFLDNINDIVYTTDLEGKLTSVNPAVQRILGFDPQEVIGTHYGRWMPREDFDRVEAVRPDVLKGQRRTNSAVLHDKQGHEHHVEISVGPLIVDGRVEGTQGIIRDVTDQRKAEQAIRQSEEMLRSLFNAATESIFLLDREGTVLAVNETAARRFGKSPAELIGTKIANVGEDRFPSSAVEYRTRRISDVLHTKQPVRFEDERAGRHFDTSAYPILDEKGDVRQIAIFGKDVTERKHAAGEIKELQRQVEFVLGATKTGLNITDKDFNLRFVDANWRRLYGAYQGRKCYEYFQGRDHPCPECGIPEALKTKQIAVYEGVLPKEGNRPIQVSTIPFQGKDGEWLVAELNIDVTERHHLERRLRESEERYRTLVETAGETIAVVDAQGVFQFLNATAGRRLGGRPADFVGKTMWELFPKEIADRQMATIRQVIQTMAGANTIVPSYAGGEWRWYNTTVEPLKDSAGNVTAALVVARDIHELRTAQQELETYREKMIRAEHLASLGTLGAMLSHEMMQPLTVIRLSIQNARETLAGASAPPTVLEDLDDGLAGVSDATAIVKRFRDFAGRPSDRRIESVSLSAVGHRVVRLLEESARRARIVLDVSQLDALPPLQANVRDLEQVFFILAQNAIQAADGSRERFLRVAGACRDDAVELQFADDCGGIAPPILERLFDPFVTTKPSGEGTGLGLCVVHRIVSQAGGRLTVDSRWGAGTRFSVTLPIRAAKTE